MNHYSGVSYYSWPVGVAIYTRYEDFKHRNLRAPKFLYLGRHEYEQLVSEKNTHYKTERIIGPIVDVRGAVYGPKLKETFYGIEIVRVDRDRFLAVGDENDD